MYGLGGVANLSIGGPAARAASVAARNVARTLANSTKRDGIERSSNANGSANDGKDNGLRYPHAGKHGQVEAAIKEAVWKKVPVNLTDLRSSNKNES